MEGSNRRRKCFDAVLSAQDQQRDKGKQCEKVLANASCNVFRESAKKLEFELRRISWKQRLDDLQANSLPQERERIILNSRGKELAARHARERQEFVLKALAKSHPDSLEKISHAL